MAAKGDPSLQIHDGAYTDASVVTPHDTNPLGDGPTRALHISVGGALKVTMVGGTAVTFAAVPVGIMRIAVTHVWSAGTAATGIVALY